MTDLDPRLTDESAQKVLARALELQAHNAGGLAVAEILASVGGAVLLLMIVFVIMRLFVAG